MTETPPLSAPLSSDELTRYARHIVLSEVGYYWQAATLLRVVAQARSQLREGGVLLACHWRNGVVDYPLTGDWVHEIIESTGIPRLAVHTERDFVMAIYSDDDRSVADHEGLT